MIAARLAIAGALSLVLLGCGDDGNDAAVAAQLDADRVAALTEQARAEAAATTTVPPTSVAAPDSEDGAAPETTAPAAPTTAPPTGVVHQVIALDNSFRPDRIEIAAGDEVLWENRGLNEHDVLYVESDEWGVETVDFQPGDVFLHRFSVPGEYRYYCSVHGNEDVGMVGTVVVTG